MFKTAESVSPRHPDKLCDQISDAILDFCLSQDAESRVAIETMGGHGLITITGELSTKAIIKTEDIRNIVNRLVGADYELRINIVRQSPEIAQGVNTGGAGDQGVMVAYACSENEALIPNELYLAREICRYIYSRHREDGKTQVTIDEGKIKTIVASFCRVSSDEIRQLIIQWWRELKKNNSLEPDFKILANPAGDWQRGGFEADTGVTGRKLAIDNYGPQIPIGGGAFSGKDASKVDRTGAYMARRIAVDLLRENNYQEVIVKLAYAIGQKEPVMAIFEATHKNTNDQTPIVFIKGEINQERYDLTPAGMIKYLDLKKAQFASTASWGAFGRGFAWDK